jgi:hypothetical protein
LLQTIHISELWDCTKENLTVEDLTNNFLKPKVSDGNTAWYLAA